MPHTETESCFFPFPLRSVLLVFNPPESRFLPVSACVRRKRPPPPLHATPSIHDPSFRLICGAGCRIFQRLINPQRCRNISRLGGKETGFYALSAFKPVCEIYLPLENSTPLPSYITPMCPPHLFFSPPSVLTPVAAGNGEP